MTIRETVLTIVTLCLVAFVVSVLAVLTFFPYVPDPGLSNLNMDVYSLLAPLSILFLLGLLYAWLVKLGTRETIRRSPRFKSLVQFLSVPFRNLLTSLRTVSLSDSARSFKILSRPRLMLGISLFASILLALVPYRPDLNPSGTLVGIDSPTYVTWINQMLQRPLLQALQYSFVEGLDGSRPLLLIPLYLVASAGVSPDLIIEYLPMVLAPLLSLSSYVFVRFGQGSASLAGLTALFTSTSLYVTIGMWGGYYANMLAMIEVFLFLTCLLRFSKSPSVVRYSVMFALSAALFLTHPWTWVLIITTSLVFGISVWKETRQSIHLRSMIGIVVAGIILDVLKSNVFSTRTVAADIAITASLAGTNQVASSWTNVVDALLFTHGGLLGNWMLLALGLVSVFALRFRDWFERLLILWVAVTSMPFLAMDSYHQARLVYDLPIPVLASVALVFFLPLVGGRNVRWSGLQVVLVLVVSASYALKGILQV